MEIDGVGGGGGAQEEERSEGERGDRVDKFEEEEEAQMEEGELQQADAAAAAAAGGENESEDGGSEETSSTGGGPAADEDTVSFKLLSPLGGAYLEFTMSRGKKANVETNDELQTHLSNIFCYQMGIREAFEKAVSVSSWKDAPWTDVDQVGALIARLNKCIQCMVNLWKGQTRPVSESDWFKPDVTAGQLTKLSSFSFNRAVQNAAKLNKCYKAFSSQTYGETSYNQVQIILDKLELNERDVFVDLGSGVGHVITFVSGYTRVKRAVGIEINELPAVKATFMTTEFKNMMKWYGKKYRPFELIRGDFLHEEHKDLIIKEATVIFINNYMFDAQLMYHIKQMVMDMADGTRIICTKSLLEERNAEQDADKGRSRPVTGRTINRQTVDMMLDMAKFPLCELPVSWSKGESVKFYLFTVNHAKIEQIFQEANNSGQNSTRSGSAESNRENELEKSIADTINEVASSSKGGAHAGRKGAEVDVQMYSDDEDSDDEDYMIPATASRKWAGLKVQEKRRAADDEYTPAKKRSSTGASASRSTVSVSSASKRDQHKREDKKKDKPSSRSGRAAAAVSTSDHGMIKQEGSKKIKSEEGVAPHSRSSRATLEAVTLDPSNSMDRHLIEVRQQYMDFMTYLTTEEAKRRLLEEFHAQTVRKQELQARISQMVSCVEQLLNTGVQTLNARLQELEMTDVKCPADILANSKQIVTSHKDITLKVAAMESEVCGLETGLRTAVPYAQLLLEKLETVDLATDDDYDKIILAARAENAATAGEENELPSVQLPDHLLSPSGTPAARRPRARPRASQARRSG
ncbi:hypothetical protein PFISCL1PPCAC_18535, partial [Pristionchus fissidentatus]